VNMLRAADLAFVLLDFGSYVRYMIVLQYVGASGTMCYEEVIITFRNEPGLKRPEVLGICDSLFSQGFLKLIRTSGRNDG
jgi:hypothetical protein